MLEMGPVMAGPLSAVQHVWDGGPVAVFWDRERQAVVAHVARVGGEMLTFGIQDGALVDEQTGSRWTVDGHAVDGPLGGERLELVAEAYVAFWFAWASFQPHTEVWASGPLASAAQEGIPADRGQEE